MIFLSMHSWSCECLRFLLSVLSIHRIVINVDLKETIMWTKPAATEMRFGFEVTMYVMNK